MTSTSNDGSMPSRETWRTIGVCDDTGIPPTYSFPSLAEVLHFDRFAFPPVCPPALVADNRRGGKLDEEHARAEHIYACQEGVERGDEGQPRHRDLCHGRDGERQQADDAEGHEGDGDEAVARHFAFIMSIEDEFGGPDAEDCMRRSAVARVGGGVCKFVDDDDAGECEEKRNS